MTSAGLATPCRMRCQAPVQQACRLAEPQAGSGTISANEASDIAGNQLVCNASVGAGVFLVHLPHLAATLRAFHSLLLSLTAQAADHHRSGLPRGPVGKHLVMLPWLEAVHDVGSSSWPMIGLLANTMLAIALCKQPWRPCSAQVDCWLHQGFSAKGLRLHPMRPDKARMYYRMPRPRMGPVWAPHQRSGRSKGTTVGSCTCSA